MQNKWQQLLTDRSERVQQKTRKKRYGKYILRWSVTLLILVMLVFGSICGLRLRHFYRAIHGEIPAESPDLSKFPVKGIDISRYQGDIDWDVLSKEDHVQFAFIKATEGSTYQDDLFTQNWRIIFSGLNRRGKNRRIILLQLFPSWRTPFRPSLILKSMMGKPFPMRKPLALKFRRWQTLWKHITGSSRFSIPIPAPIWII